MIEYKPNSLDDRLNGFTFISPLPPRLQKPFSEESEINKLNGFSNPAFSERNPYFDANQSDVERSEVQQFQPHRLVNLN